LFEGEKTRVFWWGLIILGISVVELFAVFWYRLVAFFFFDWRVLGPPIFGGVVFLFIGLYMMNAGVKKGEEKPQS
jgi:putative Mn2+ efflux pump MntP